MAKMQEYIKTTEEAKMNSNPVKCKVLVENIQSSYNETAKLLEELETVDIKMANQKKITLVEVLTALVERNKLIKTEKAVS